MATTPDGGRSNDNAKYYGSLGDGKIQIVGTWPVTLACLEYGLMILAMLLHQVHKLPVTHRIPITGFQTPMMDWTVKTFGEWPCHPVPPSFGTPILAHTIVSNGNSYPGNNTGISFLHV